MYSVISNILIMLVKKPNKANCALVCVSVRTNWVILQQTTVRVKVNSRKD